MNGDIVQVLAGIGGGGTRHVHHVIDEAVCIIYVEHTEARDEQHACGCQAAF